MSIDRKPSDGMYTKLAGYYIDNPPKHTESNLVLKENINLAHQLAQELDQSQKYTLHNFWKGYKENYVYIKDNYEKEGMFYVECKKDDQPQATGETNLKEKETRRIGYLNFCTLAGFLIPESKDSQKLIRNEDAIKDFLKKDDEFTPPPQPTPEW